jgi:pyruvyltransferase
MPTVEIYSWNPVRRAWSGPIGRRIPVNRPVNNFGDLLGPLVVRGMLRRHGIDEHRAVADAQLVSVGSVIHLARPGAVVWGSGINGKVLPDDGLVRALDFRAVRGPRTREHLLGRGVDVPEVFGDPALLLGEIRPDLLDVPRTRDVTVVPNLNDLAHYPRSGVLDPRRPLEECLQIIASSRLVVGSSLHGIIVAEALGVPARLVRSTAEPEFKYADHYLGTGRPEWAAAGSVQEAIRMGGEAPVRWSGGPLIEAFPTDLWLGAAPASGQRPANNG